MLQDSTAEELRCPAGHRCRLHHSSLQLTKLLDRSYIESMHTESSWLDVEMRQQQQQQKQQQQQQQQQQLL